MTSTQSDSRFSGTIFSGKRLWGAKNLSLLIAGLGVALTLSFSTTSHAIEADLRMMDGNDLQALLNAEDNASLDDIYADFSKTADARHRPGHGPGPGYGPGHGPGHGPGYPPPGYGPGYGPGHGPGYGPPPGHGRPRVQCRAQNARGLVFYGRGRNVPQAQDDALDRCYRVSRRCQLQGCHRI